MASIDGFEDGDLSEWTPYGGSSVGVVTSPVAEGNYAAEVHVSGGNNQYMKRTFPEGVIAPGYIQGYIRNNSSQSYDDCGMKWYDGDPEGSGVQIISAHLKPGEGQFELNGADITGQISPSAGTWYFIEYKNIDWTNNQVGSISVNGSSVLSNQNFYSGNTASGVDYLDLGNWSGLSHDSNMYFDELSIGIPNTAPDAPTNPSPIGGATGVTLN